MTITKIHTILKMMAVRKSLGSTLLIIGLKPMKTRPRFRAVLTFQISNANKVARIPNSSNKRFMMMQPSIYIS